MDWGRTVWADAIELLACPRCGESLSLNPRDQAIDGHIMEGELGCSAWDRQYSIRRGAPRLVPFELDDTAEKTVQRFGDQWKTFDHMSSYQEQWLKDWLSPIGPEDFSGKLVLEGGCGKGRHTPDGKLRRSLRLTWVMLWTWRLGTLET